MPRVSLPNQFIKLTGLQGTEKIHPLHTPCFWLLRTRDHLFFESPRSSNTLFNKCMETSLRQNFFFTLGLAFLAPAGSRLFLISYFCYSCLLACLLEHELSTGLSSETQMSFFFKSLPEIWHLYVLWVSGKAACTMTLANGFQVIKQTWPRRAIFSGKSRITGGRDT